MEYKKAVRKKYLECAKVLNTHGVKGAVRLENYTDSPEKLKRLPTVYLKQGENYIPLKVEHAAVQKDMVLAKLEGIDTVEAAICLKNKILYADRSCFHLKKGDYFIADIIGLPVIDAEKDTPIGVLKNVLAPAGQQVYVVEKKDGASFMIPCVNEFIKKISFGEDCDAGIYVKLIEGMEDTLI